LVETQEMQSAVCAAVGTDVSVLAHHETVELRAIKELEAGNARDEDAKKKFDDRIAQRNASISLHRERIKAHRELKKKV
jgi:hypothetical protein